MLRRGGSSGSYNYSVAYGGSLTQAQAANYPVFDVTWGDAARFCNWLQNGQPTNLGETTGSTETGAYTLNGDTSVLNETRNSGATYFCRRSTNGTRQRITPAAVARTMNIRRRAKQHGAEQHAVVERDQQRQFGLQRQLYRPDGLT